MCTAIARIVENMSEHDPFPGREPRPDQDHQPGRPDPWASGGQESAAEQPTGDQAVPPAGAWHQGQQHDAGPAHQPHAYPPTGYQHPAWAWQDRADDPLGTSPGYSGSGPGAGSGQPATGRRPRRIGTVITAAVVAGVVGAGTGIGSYALLTDHQDSSSASSVQVSNQPAPASAKTNGSIEAAANKIEPSVVTITKRSGSGGDLGSGVVTDHNGHILTNAHVVSSSTDQSQTLPGRYSESTPSKITVTLSNGKTTPAKIVGVDKTDDLAVLKAEHGKNLKPATFAESSDVKTGQSVVAVGAPLGLSRTVTSGIVSNTHRPVRSGKSNNAVYEAIQTDAAINPGNSGGPLVNLNGDVVGINSAIKSTSQGSGQGSGQAGNIGIGFAIPSHIATRVAGQLIDDGEAQHAALGVTISAADNGPLASTKSGVTLKAVKQGDAADQAGLKTGDVITKLNDFTVTTSNGLIAATRYCAPGDTVSVTYHRDGSSHTAKVTLGTA